MSSPRMVMALAVLVAAGCNSDQSFDQRDARVAFVPSLLDVGDVAVGSEGTGLVEIDHVDGPDAEILNIVVTNFSGTAFRYDGDEQLVVERSSRLQLPIVFAPVAEGWFTGRVEIAHDGIGSPVQVDVRGHGVVAETGLAPLVLEFGRVGPGEVESRDVTLSNTGSVDLLISEAVFDHPAFALGLSLPASVAAGAGLRLPVQFTPVDVLPVEAALSVRVGELVLPAVTLLANNCESGLPEAYDEDQDGVTSCGGDCDDDSAAVRPGVAELADGIDQDCDTVTDEGTTAFDDDADGLSEDDGDCNDGLSTVHPDLSEVLGNGIDDDCDGVVDLGTTDEDFDGTSTDGGDCDDADAGRHPGAVELANNVDDDCDGVIDEGTARHDDDGDGQSEDDGDCDDTDPDTSLGSPELSDGRDNSCDGVVDEGTNGHDDDGDGYTEIGGDCDDADATASPGLGTCP